MRVGSSRGRTLRASTRVLAAGIAVVVIAACTDTGDAVDPGDESLFPSDGASADDGSSGEPLDGSGSPSDGPDPVASGSDPADDDPFAVPDEITDDYVERVLNEIARLNAEATVTVLRMPVDQNATSLPADLEDDLTALYEEPALGITRELLVELLSDSGQREDLKEPKDFGQVRYSVEEVLEHQPCVIALVDRDLSETDLERLSTRTTKAFVVLAPAPRESPVGWQIASLLFPQAAVGSAEETALTTYSAEDLAEFVPEVCA